MEGGGSGLGGGDQADGVPGEAIGGEVVVQGPPGLVICDAGEEALGFWGGLLGEGGESRQRARVPGEAEEAALVEVWGGLGKGVEGGAGGVVVCKAGEGEGGFGEGGGQRAGEAEVDGAQGGVVHRRGVPAGGYRGEEGRSGSASSAGDPQAPDAEGQSALGESRGSIGAGAVELEDVRDGGVQRVVVRGGCQGHDAGRGGAEEVVGGGASAVAEEVKLALKAIEVSVRVGEVRGGGGF